MTQHDHITLEDHLESLGWLNHMPPAPFPRTDMMAETVYAQRWNELMHSDVEDDRRGGCPNGMLDYILRESPYWLDQDIASLCARIVCWFGSNCGRDFIDQARKLSDKVPYGGFQQQWSIENRRRSGINQGYRTLEWLVMEEVNRPEYLGGSPKCDRGFLLPKHWETADLLMGWLEDKEGREFLAGCLFEIEARQRAQRTAQRAEWQRNADLKQKLARIDTLIEAERDRQLGPEQTRELVELLVQTRVRP